MKNPSFTLRKIFATDNFASRETSLSFPPPLIPTIHLIPPIFKPHKMTKSHQPRKKNYFQLQYFNLDISINAISSRANLEKEDTCAKKTRFSFETFSFFFSFVNYSNIPSTLSEILNFCLLKQVKIIAVFLLKQKNKWEKSEKKRRKKKWKMKKRYN